MALDAYDAADAAALVRADAGTEDPSSAVAAVAVDAGRDFIDGAAKEMMDQLRRETLNPKP